jgi:hypothetical protein
MDSCHPGDTQSAPSIENQSKSLHHVCSHKVSVRFTFHVLWIQLRVLTVFIILDNFYIQNLSYAFTCILILTVFSDCNLPPPLLPNLKHAHGKQYSSKAHKSTLPIIVCIPFLHNIHSSAFQAILVSENSTRWYKLPPLPHKLPHNDLLVEENAIENPSKSSHHARIREKHQTITITSTTSLWLAPSDWIQPLATNDCSH